MEFFFFKISKVILPKMNAQKFSVQPKMIIYADNHCQSDLDKKISL